MTIPAIQYAHSDGVTDSDCTLTITYFVSDNNGATWASSGTVYTDLVNATSNGKLTLIPNLTTFGSTSATRLVKVVYTNDSTS